MTRLAHRRPTKSPRQGSPALRRNGASDVAGELAAMPVAEPALRAPTLSDPAPADYAAPGAPHGGGRSLLALAPHVPGGLRVFFTIAERWALTPAEQRTLLGEPARTTFHRWQNNDVSPGTVNTGLIERLSHLLAIYQALHGLYLDDRRADAWIRQPNAAPPFDRRPPLAVMLDGTVGALLAVRGYVEAATQPGY